MKLGIYVHIPYCVQRCSYCDFATYEQSQIMPPHQYVDLLKKEIEMRHHQFSPQVLESLYFGGGTPSLISPQLIVSIIHSLASKGFSLGPNTEVTIEINPATIDEKKMQQYLAAGINRFSVGAQTFSNPLLTKVGRIHSAEDTRNTLTLLKKYQVKYSFDLLFALPGQTLSDLSADIDEIMRFRPVHVSPYCLTIPTGHPLNLGRPPDDGQIDMFRMIHSALTSTGYERYEISNFALPGYESIHNQLYWTDQSYWGIGLGAHSYLSRPYWGKRFWNANTMELYESQLQQVELPDAQVEILNQYQSMTDYCHTALRRSVGLSEDAFTKKFGASSFENIVPIMEQLRHRGLIQSRPSRHWSLTENGVLICNQVFEALTFTTP